MVDHCIKSHEFSEEAKAAAEAAGQDIYSYLNQTLVALAQNGQIDTLTSELHVCPTFTETDPRANPSLKGMISGLRLSARVEDLARVYLATIQAIAYGTKHIIDTNECLWLRHLWSAVVAVLKIQFLCNSMLMQPGVAF